MHEIKSEPAPPVFLPKFQKRAHPYPTNFSKLVFNQLSRSKYRIYVRGLALWNEFLTNSEKEIENLLLFKSKEKSKLLSYENEVIFF